MHILHVNNVANVGLTLVAGLTRLGHTAELHRLQLVAGRHGTAIKLLVLPARLKEMRAVNWQVKANTYDIVHIHFAYLGWLGIIGRYPYFLHCHGSDVRRGLRDPVRSWPIRQSLKHAQAVFFATPDLAPVVQQIRPNALFLPNPINIDQFHPRSEPENDPLKVLIISTLYPVKKVSVAFEGVRQYLARYPKVQITAIDYGPERKLYHGEPGVFFSTPVPYEMMPALINSHDIIIGQFGIGSLGMAELESMACGKPVICHFEHGDWYPEPPPVFSTDQPAQVAEYLGALTEDRLLRRERGEQGRDWVQQHHGYIAIARQLEQVYGNSSSASGIGLC